MRKTTFIPTSVLLLRKARQVPFKEDIAALKMGDKFNPADPSMAGEKCYQKKYAKSAQLAANAAAANRQWERLRPLHKSKEDLSFALY